VLFGAPLLLLHSSPATASHASAAARPAHAGHRDAVYPASHLDGVKLPSHLVAYQAPTTTTTAAPTTTTTAPPPTTTTTVVHARAIPPPTTTTTTTAPPRNREVGQATWYSEAPAGYCASPTLPHGTVLTVVNNATGASTVCTVDDHEAAGYPRVVDLSPEGFAQIADPSQGVVEVTISW
jgi:rare lipoprotein A (peptidoglycan hydrolase)